MIKNYVSQFLNLPKCEPLDPAIERQQKLRTWGEILKTVAAIRLRLGYVYSDEFIEKAAGIAASHSTKEAAFCALENACSTYEKRCLLEPIA